MGGNVVVDFTAPGWCQPCIRFAPHFDMASLQLKDLTFIAVDVDKAPWAMTRFGIMSVPTVRLFKSSDDSVDLKERAVVPLIKEINSCLTQTT